jgi:hypothetical protein
MGNLFIVTSARTGIRRHNHAGLVFSSSFKKPAVRQIDQQLGVPSIFRRWSGLSGKSLPAIRDSWNAPNNHRILDSLVGAHSQKMIATIPRGSINADCTPDRIGFSRYRTSSADDVAALPQKLVATIECQFDPPRVTSRRTARAKNFIERHPMPICGPEINFETRIPRSCDVRRQFPWRSFDRAPPLVERQRHGSVFSPAPPEARRFQLALLQSDFWR